jgi:glycosyltransferase involved in cell wall biosynthesis
MKLTIGTATYDDFCGTWFTVQSARMHHPASTHDAEIIVVDNNPEGQHGRVLREHSAGCRYRYEPFTGKTGTSARDEIFRLATGDYVIVLDCHVLLMPGSIASLLEYWSQNPDSKDILSGPMMHDDLVNMSTSFSPGWRDSMYGTWNYDKEGMESEKPFEIPMMGLGAFACRRDAWPGFNQHFRGFGAEEGYIHEKFRLRGGKAICVPKFKWLHRFGRPDGVKYPLRIEDRIWNYIVGWMELHGDPKHEVITGALNHFKDKFDPNKMIEMVEKAINIYERHQHE